MAGAHHGHDHAAVTQANERKVLLSLLLIFGFMIVEVVGGLLSGSLALLADAGHMLADSAALALAYAAFRLGRRAADGRRTYGYLRLEVVAGFVNAMTLLLIVGWIAVEAWARFDAPRPVLAGPMMAVALAGLLVNLVVLWVLTRGDHAHVNIRGAVLHVLGDLLGSVGAVAAAIVIAFTGWTPIDPILSVAVALLILRSAWALLAQSLHILLEGAPDGAAPAEIEHHLMHAVPGLAGVSHVHVWSITSGRTLATLHVRPARDEDARGVVRAVEQELRTRFAIGHATVALDWNDGATACSMAGAPGGHDHHGHDHHHHDHAGHGHAGHRGH